jgi:hypothetical protein
MESLFRSFSSRISALQNGQVPTSLTGAEQEGHCKVVSAMNVFYHMRKDSKSTQIKTPLRKNRSILKTPSFPVF